MLVTWPPVQLLSPHLSDKAIEIPWAHTVSAPGGVGAQADTPEPLADPLPDCPWGAICLPPERLRGKAPDILYGQVSCLVLYCADQLRQSLHGDEGSARSRTHQLLKLLPQRHGRLRSLTGTVSLHERRTA